MFVGESTAMRFLEPDRAKGEMSSTTNQFIAGSVGGLLQCIALVPSEVVKCTMQTTNLHGTDVSTVQGSAFHQTTITVRKIFQKEGIRGFYKGFGPTALRDIPSIGFYFFTYTRSRDWMGKLEQGDTPLEPGQTHHEPSSMATMIAGGLAGTISWVVVYPMDVIKTVTQVSKGPVLGNPKAYSDMNSLEVGRTLLRHHGVQIFFRGLGPTVLRAFPVNATTFFFYEKFKKLLHTD